MSADVSGTVCVKEECKNTEFECCCKECSSVVSTSIEEKE